MKVQEQLHIEFIGITSSSTILGRFCLGEVKEVPEIRYSKDHFTGVQMTLRVFGIYGVYTSEPNLACLFDSQKVVS